MQYVDRKCSRITTRPTIKSNVLPPFPRISRPASTGCEMFLRIEKYEDHEISSKCELAMSTSTSERSNCPSNSESTSISTTNDQTFKDTSSLQATANTAEIDRFKFEAVDVLIAKKL